MPLPLPPPRNSFLTENAVQSVVQLGYLQQGIGMESIAMDLSAVTVKDLLVFGVDANAELRRRGIIRTENNSIGDFAEYLFCRAFSWRPVNSNSEKEMDAVGPDRTRYQIKARRLAGNAGDRQLSALRKLPEKGFDKLAAVLFDARFGIERAAIIPHALVLANATHQGHTNSWRFILRDEVWTWEGVEDVTAVLRAALMTVSAEPAQAEPRFSVLSGLRKGQGAISRG